MSYGTSPSQVPSPMGKASAFGIMHLAVIRKRQKQTGYLDAGYTKSVYVVSIKNGAVKLREKLSTPQVIVVCALIEVSLTRFVKKASFQRLNRINAIMGVE